MMAGDTTMGLTDGRPSDGHHDDPLDDKCGGGNQKPPILMTKGSTNSLEVCKKSRRLMRRSKY